MEDREFLVSMVKHLHERRHADCLEFIRADSGLGDLFDQRKSASRIKAMLYKYLGLDKLGAGAAPGKKEFWLLRGYTEEEATGKRKERYAKQDYKTTSAYSRTAKQYEGLTEEQITFEINSRRATNIEYWLKKHDGDGDLAKRALFEFQQSASIKSAAKNKGNMSRTISQIGYWIKKGFSEEEARLQVAATQDILSLKSTITREGILKGCRTYLHRSNDWSTASSARYKAAIILAYLEFRNDRTIGKDAFLDHHERILKGLNYTSGGHASEESLVFFGPMFGALKDKYTCHIGAFGQKEFALKRNGKAKAEFRYDFVIEELKLIFEYDGAYWHDIDQEGVLKLHAEKDALANQHGYQVVRLAGFGSDEHTTITIQQNVGILKSHFPDEQISWPKKRKFYYGKKDWKRKNNLGK